MVCLYRSSIPVGREFFWTWPRRLLPAARGGERGKDVTPGGLITYKHYLRNLTTTVLDLYKDFLKLVKWLRCFFFLLFIYFA